MNNKKSIFKVFSIIIISIFVLSTNVAAVSEKGKISVENSEIKEIRKSKEENNSKIEPIIPYRLRSKAEKENAVLDGRDSKLSGEVKKQYQGENKRGLIPVLISVHYDYSEEEFETEVVKLLGHDIKFQKTEPMSYELSLTKEQIDILESMQQVWHIYSPEEGEPTSYICGEISDDSYLTLNAATEMTGTKKARTDFGVTGNRDGNETSYSKDDIVIAVLDSGIDAKHVDLDGGKVIAWYDAVNSKSEPYDDKGHGTHVSSIIAGTGEGDPGIQAGFAPGVALVGVKVIAANGFGSVSNIKDGLQWVWDNKSTYGIDAVNMSLGTHASYSAYEEVINLINNLNNVGILVFVAAGNEGNGDLGYYYNTLSTYAKYTPFSVGSLKDPYEGGWGLSDFSSRGTGLQGPWLCAPGSSIRAAKAGSTSEYITMNGTSMATPAVAGTYALMLNSALNNNNHSLYFDNTDLGVSGFDKCYGYGSLDSYESIKNSGNLTGSFNDYRDIISTSATVSSGTSHIYNIKVYGAGAAFNSTLLILSEDNENLDLYIWEPGKSWQNDPATFYSNTNTDMPYESISISNPKEGTYSIAVAGIDSANYSIDFCGQISNP